MNHSLSAEQAAHVRALLSSWDIPSIINIESIHEPHAVYKVTTLGPTFTLKDMSHAADLVRLAFTHSVLTHVAQAGLRVPIPLRSRNLQITVSQQGHSYLLYEYIEAGAYPNNSAQMVELLFNTGRAIAQLHQALATYADPDFSAKTWREDLSAPIAKWLYALASGLPADQATIISAVASSRGTAITQAMQGLPEQLIHRDCHPGNVLVQGTHVSGFIDCDHISIGPRVFDLAYYAVHHLKWITGDPAATNAWLNQFPHVLRGYQSLQPLTQAELHAFPYALMVYHLLLAHWFMVHGHAQPIALEVNSLHWIHNNFDAIGNAILVD